MRQHRRPSLSVTMPTEKVEAAKGQEYCGDAAEQRQQAHRAPQDGSAGGNVAGERIVRKIVGVRVGLSGPSRGTDPCCPSEEGSQLMELVRIVNQTGGKPAIVSGCSEIVAPRFLLSLE